jgi:serine/threonine protein kinase
MQIDKPQATSFKKTQPSQHKIPVEGQTELHSEQPIQDLDSRKERFGSHRKLSESSSELSLESDLQALESQIQQVKEENLLEKSQTLPDPNTMQRVRSQVQRSQTVPLVQAQNFDLGDLGLNDDETRGLKQDLNKAMLEMGRDPKEKIQDYLSDHLKPLLKELSKAEKQLIGSDHAKEKVNGKAQAQMIALMQSLGQSDELSPLLISVKSNLSDTKVKTELRNLIAGVVGELREGKPQAYSELSDKKKAFVNNVIDGLLQGMQGSENRGIPPQSPGYKGQPTPLSTAWDNLEAKLKTQLGQLSPGQVAQLKLKSNPEIETLFLPIFGKSSLLSPLLIKTVREFTPAIAPRSQETSFKALTREDLLSGIGVQTTLQALGQTPGNQQARTHVCDALLPHIQDLLKDPNAKMQLQLLGKNGLAYLLTSAMPKQEGQTQVQKEQRNQDILWLTEQIQNLIPPLGHVSDQMVTLNHPTHGTMDAPTQLTIGGKTYEAPQFLDKAGFGAVFAYSEVGHPENKVAVKLILNQGNTLSTKDVEARQEIIKEINLHSELQGTEGHSNIIGLKGTLSGPDGSLYMVQEFAPGGSLNAMAQKLEKAQTLELLNPEARRLMGTYLVKQSLEGLEYMHDEREMLHMDIKPYNLLLGNDGNVKLIDFGTSHIGTQRDLHKRLVDNPIFLAPEHLGTGTTQAGKGSDIWSMGTVAYRLLVGDHEKHSFFHNKGFMFEIEKELSDHAQDVNRKFMDHSPEMPENGPSETDKPVFELINSLMAPTPDQRPSAKQALEHELFQDQRLQSPELKRVFEKLAQPFPSWCLTPESQVEFSAQSSEEQLKARMMDLKPELQALGLA